MSRPVPPRHDEILLETALKLLRQGGAVADLVPDALCASAGLPASAFVAAYPSTAKFQVALFQRLLDESRSVATQAASEPGRGPIQLKRGIEAYIDSHLRHPAVRELTLKLRNDESAQALIARRVSGFQRVLQVGLSALRALHPLASAQLLTAMVIETTQAEFEARRPLPEMRETLYAYVDRIVP